MRPSTHQALLLLADISGFTQFMKSHARAADHAMHVVVELLRAVISAAGPPLKLAEVEGDAAFFYAICPEEGGAPAEVAAIKRQVRNFFRSFHHTLDRLCAAYPCARDARELKLKVIIHAGAVALEHIHGFDKLFGVDVILAHRLLKNSVPAPEYVLLTEPAHNWLGGFFQIKPERQIEYCEGIGVVDTVVFFPPAHSARPITTPVADYWESPAKRLPAALNATRPRFDLERSPRRSGVFMPPRRVSFRPLPVRRHAQPAATVWIAQLQTKWRRDDPISHGSAGRQRLSCGPAP